MRRKRIYSLLLALALAAGLLTGCGQENTAQEDAADEALPTLAVGVDTFPPYSYIGPDGTPVGIDIGPDGTPGGIDVELATEAFRRMGYRAEFRFIDWAEKGELLESGYLDCVWCCFSMDGREDEYRWAGPYMVSRQVVAVALDSDITTLAELEDRVLAVQVTTKPEEMFLSPDEFGLPHLRQLFSLQNRELIYPFLSRGYADAIAAHETSIRQYMADYGVEVRILDEPLLTVGLGVAFDRNDQRGLEQALNETLAEMRADGTTEAIIGRYLPDAAAYLEVDG